VHLNFPLREPLVTDLPPDRTAGARPGGAPYVRRSTPVARPLQGALTEVLAGAERPVLVAGRGGFAAPLAGRLNWPMLADPLSGSR
jgi:2-succinyl-5-enolpyruvyl-6-hydroxy-3-cyclohexene-1-carboxylate synthase